MCGIFGYIASKDQRPDPGIIRAATDSLFARGPDSSGYAQNGRVAFGARRLAIIDLESGNQPIESQCGKVVAMQNGEVYNYQELRSELLRLGFPLRTTGDTEVLTYGYMAWGIDGLLERLDGMYAFAVHDRANNLVHIARDRMGEKPLFYHADGRHLVFSSQLLTVARYPGVPFRLNPSGVEAYLSLHFVPGDETILEGIHKLPPGHVLTYRLGDERLTVRRYWHLQPQPVRSGVDREALREELRSRVQAAVSSRLVSDVPVGAFLSGGIDSSIVVACMAGKVADLKTFSVGFETPELDESPYARAVAAKFGTDHHHLTFGLNDFEHLLPDVVSSVDEPIGDQAMLPALWMARLARQHVTVVLSGEGADEIFGGYGYYRPRMLPPDWRRTAYDALRPFAKLPEENFRLLAPGAVETPSGYPLLMAGSGLAAVLRRTGVFEKTPWADRFASDLGEFRDPLQAACFTDLTTWLPDNLLVKFDKMAMGVSLEGRCPYLQPSLVEWALGLPQDLKIGSRHVKELLREAFADALPDTILRRPKQGFILPLSQWFRHTGRSMMMDYLGVAIDDGVLRSDRLRRTVEGWLDQPEPPGRNLMALLLYRMWLVHAYQQPKFRPKPAESGEGSRYSLAVA